MTTSLSPLPEELSSEVEQLAIGMIFGNRIPDESAVWRGVAAASQQFWRQVAASEGAAIADRCFAAWKVNDERLWKQLYFDPAFAELRDFIGSCFPRYRLERTAHRLYQSPIGSYDSYRLELENILRELIADADQQCGSDNTAPRGRLYWRDLKRLYPTWRSNPTVRAIFANAFKTQERTFITRGDLHARPQRNRFDVTCRELHHAGFVAVNSTFGKGVPQILLMFNTSVEMDRRIAREPLLDEAVTSFRRFIAVGSREDEPFPVDCNLVAWLRIETDSIPGAWLIDELQAPLGQEGKLQNSHFRENANFQLSSEQDVQQLKGRILEFFSGWEDSAMATAIQIARINQIGDLYFRAPESVRQTSGSIFESTVRSLYKRLPQKYGFKRLVYRDPATGQDHRLWYRKIR